MSIYFFNKITALLLLSAALLYGCIPPSEASSEAAKADSLEVSDTLAAVAAKPFFNIPLADGFDFPLGPPNAKAYYNAQPFGRNFHLGDDWNGIGGGNTDLGDSVHSIALGVVVFAEDIAGGWGNVVRIIHRIDTAKWLESVYAHLDTILTSKGELLQRGQILGTVGNAGGLYLAHLHLEIRDSLEMDIGPGYGEQIVGYLDPTKFIKSNRKRNLTD